MLENGEWGGEPKIVAFSELYKVNVTVYNAMTRSIQYPTAKNEKENHTVHLLMVNNNYFNALHVKKIKANFHISKSKKKQKKKCESF